MKKYSNIEVIGSIIITGSFSAPSDLILEATSSNAVSSSYSAIAVSSSYSAIAVSSSYSAIAVSSSLSQTAKLATSASFSSTVGTVNANTITTGTVPVVRLGTSGTRNTSTFLRGDNTWATVDTDPAWATTTFLTGESNFATAGVFQVYYNSNDQFYFRMSNIAWSPSRTMRRCGYWVPSTNAGGSNSMVRATVNNTTWVPFWQDTALTITENGGKEWMVISATLESNMNQDSIDGDFVYQIVVAKGASSNRMSWRRVTAIGAGYDFS
jgi:hypothetical protein